MNVDIKEIGRNDSTNELEFNIVDIDTNTTVGFLFTAGNHIAYEVWPEFRGNNIATDALKKITRRISHPVLEITHDNMASQRVATKAGYKLVRNNSIFGIYELDDDVSKKRLQRKSFICFLIDRNLCLVY